MRRINQYICVTAFSKNGEKIRSFKSIQDFLDFAQSGSKLASPYLRDIRNGRLILKNGYLVGLSKKFNYSPVNPMLCATLSRRMRIAKRENIIRLRAFNDAHQSIVVVDNMLNILGYTRRTIEELARRERVPVGTIKASLHRSARGFFSNHLHVKYYVHLKDLPTFIDNAKKTI